MYCVIAIDKRSLSREAYCISAYKKNHTMEAFPLEFIAVFCLVTLT